MFCLSFSSSSLQKCIQGSQQVINLPCALCNMYVVSVCILVCFFFLERFSPYIHIKRNSPRSVWFFFFFFSSLCCFFSFFRFDFLYVPFPDFCVCLHDVAFLFIIIVVFLMALSLSFDMFCNLVAHFMYSMSFNLGRN